MKQLSVWTYEGPPHVGAMRIATGMKGTALCPACAAGRHLCGPAVHDDRAARPPPAGHLHDLPGPRPRRRHGELFKTACCIDAYERFQPQATDRRRILHRRVDPGRSRAGWRSADRLPVPVIPLELPSYQRKENWGAAETFYQIVRLRCADAVRARTEADQRCNYAGRRRRWASATATIPPRSPGSWSKRIGHRASMSVAPLGRDSRPHDLTRLGAAHFNVVLYPEIADTAARWLEKTRVRKPR